MGSYRYSTSSYIVRDTLRLTCINIQKLRASFPEVHWMTAYTQIGEEELMTSKRDSTLRYLAFLCHEITGSRGYGRPGCLSIDSILETVAVEAYEQVLNAS